MYFVPPSKDMAVTQQSEVTGIKVFTNLCKCNIKFTYENVWLRFTFTKYAT